MTAPLENIKVIEVTSWMAAPSGAALLADMGADVVKVEPIAGDPMRGMGRPAKVDDAFGTYDLQFDVDNRGKRSLALALDTDAGQRVVRQLIETADVFLCNLLIHRQKKFGLDPDSLLRVKPNLVHATLTGYGTTGPDAWRPGYDVTAFFARSGLYDAMREGDAGTIPQARPAQGDHTTGLTIFGAILAALRVAERTGEGQVVETSLFETAIWTQATDFGITVVDQAPVRRRSRQQMLAATANRYPCGDGKWVVLNTMTADAWEVLCRTIGAEHLLDDERCVDASTRYRNMDFVVGAIDDALAAKARDEWGELFDEAGVVWGPALTLDEVPQDPHAQSIGIFPEIEHPELGPYRTVNAPMRFRDADVGPRGPAPTLGADSKTVLREIGLTAEEVQALCDAGVVAGAD